MYIFSVFKNLFRWSNLGTIIFFFLNMGTIFAIYSSAEPEVLTQLIVLYILSLVLALSPVGEWVLSMVAGARKMGRLDMRNRILPIVERVYRDARSKTPDMPKRIILKVIYDSNPNAFALGRRTICVSEGLFDLPDEMIEGVLAHEFAHIAMHHTDIQLIFGGSNYIVTGFILLLKAFTALMNLIATALTFGRRTRSAGCLLSIFTILCTAVVWLWTKFCLVFLMWSSRSNEYAADRYAFEIGYGYGLASALDQIGTGVPQNTLLREMYATHPETNDRIGRLQELGVPFSRY